MSELTKIKPSFEKPLSKETDQDFNFWNDNTWDKHLTSEKEALKSFDLMEKRRSKLSPIERRFTSNQLDRHLGRQGAVQAILNEVNNGNPPITGLRGGQAQMEFKFLNA
jgi:hypothetical protein